VVHVSVRAVRRVCSAAALLSIAATAGAQDPNEFGLTDAGSALDSLAGAAWDFTVASLALAFVVALLLEAGRDFGIRTVTHWLAVKNWSRISPGASDVTWRILALPADELCGQLAVRSRELLPPSGENEKVDQRSRHLASVLERELDALQVRLRSQDQWVALGLSLLLASMLAVFLARGLSLSSDATYALAVVSAGAGLIAPMLRQVLHRLLSA
jgi:hypothetical protein